MMRRLFAVFYARNLEFLRDRTTVIWNFLFPVVVVVGMGLVFGGGARPLFEVGVLHAGTDIDLKSHPFLATRYVKYFTVTDEAAAIRKVARHQIDLLIDLRSTPRYWVNSDSPKGYIVERLLKETDPAIVRQAVTGDAVRYIDWLLPGVIGMNMMFNCLFGVGYVVVRYRKSGYLKRLSATPLKAIEFIGAQVLSRLVLTLLVTLVIYLLASGLVGFHMRGSHLLLACVAALGAFSMIALSMFVVARFTSDELAAGVLNALTWPMMMLSGVFFSLEAAPHWLQLVAKVFPLTQMLDAARSIMIDGAGPADIALPVGYLALTGLTFLVLGAWSFKWRID
ncbi:MAG TPA: ABC transporter permease [Steroidobacteraceae bacterium]|nr:ABC transporter permease [Steroidobacteraceae bacterium]